MVSAARHPISEVCIRNSFAGAEILSKESVLFSKSEAATDEKFTLDISFFDDEMLNQSKISQAEKSSNPKVYRSLHC